MGVHESSKGVCQALTRAFDSMDCASHAQNPNSNDSPNHSQDANALDMCSNLVRRLIARGCTVPDTVRKAEWYLASELSTAQTSARA